MEFNERINIENYSLTERRSSNSFTGKIKTILIGLFFIGALVFILNSSHKYIRNYQEELKYQQIRNLEEIEVDWHMEFFNQKNSKNKSVDVKNIDSLKYEKIKFYESIAKKKENSIENSLLNDKETEVIIADSFFANRTVMLRNSSSKFKSESEKYNSKDNKIKAIKFFLANENKLNLNNFESNASFDYNNEIFNSSDKGHTNDIANLKLEEYEKIIKIAREAENENKILHYFLDYVNNLSNNNFNKDDHNEINKGFFNYSNDRLANKSLIKRNLLNTNYLNQDPELSKELEYYQKFIRQQTNNKPSQNISQENTNNDNNNNDYNGDNGNNDNIISSTKIQNSKNSPYLPGQLEDKRSSIPYISYALAENLYSNNVLNKLENFNSLTSNNRLSDDSINSNNLDDIYNDNNSNNKNIEGNNDIITSNSLINQTNKTLEDIRYEELLKKYLENRNTEELIQISTFFDRVNGKSYEGKWHGKSRDGLEKYFGNQTDEGEMDLTFEKYTEYSRFITQSTTYRIKFLKGAYIDDWLQMQGFSLTFTNITLQNRTLTAKYSSYLEYGQLFERKGESGFCDGVFSISWNNTDQDLRNSGVGKDEKDFEIKKISGSFKSNCKIDVVFELNLTDEKALSDKILNYSIVFSVFCFLQLFNTYYLSKKIDESNAFSNGISVFTIGQNVIWNCYACLFHFSMTVNFENYTYHFGIPSMLLFLNFSIFELRLLTVVWKNQNIRYTSDSILLRRKLFRLYAIIYFSIFISIFFVMRFLFEKLFIFIAVFLTFIPQIGHNLLEKNRICMPLLNVFLYSLNKLFLPFYYRGCPYNFFKISHDYLFCIGMLVLSFVMVLFLYSQSIFGARWFLPKQYKKSSENNFYKTKSEVLLDQPNAEQIDCVICLHTLLNNETLRDFSEDFVGMKEAAFSLKTKVIRFIGKLRNLIFDFYVPQKNKQKKPFMKTPCNHYFHSKCLESWLNQKKDCPTCRQEIEHF